MCLTHHVRQVDRPRTTADRLLLHSSLRHEQRTSSLDGVVNQKVRPCANKLLGQAYSVLEIHTTEHHPT